MEVTICQQTICNKSIFWFHILFCSLLGCLFQAFNGYTSTLVQVSEITKVHRLPKRSSFIPSHEISHFLQILLVFLTKRGKCLHQNLYWCVRLQVFDVTFWLLWCNSTINPVLYPFLQQKFRVAFTRLLCRRKNTVAPLNTTSTTVS